MNGRSLPDPAAIQWSCRVHAIALRLYPRGHRERWGAEMRHAFRERCRQATRERHGVPGWLLAVALPDLLLSSGRERLASLHPQQGSPMSKFTTISLGIVLQVVGSGLLALSLIALTSAIVLGRFAYPGAFDALTALQVATGVAGALLLAIGIRELVPRGKAAA